MNRGARATPWSGRIVPLLPAAAIAVLLGADAIAAFAARRPVALLAAVPLGLAAAAYLAAGRRAPPQ